MPGDIVTTEVWVKYLLADKNQWSEALENLMNAVTYGQAPTGTVIDGGTVGSIGAAAFPFPNALLHNDPGTGPKAYLNYIVTDKNYVVKAGGFKRVPVGAYEDGTDRAHTQLSFTGGEQIVITEPGYVYLYLSNENETPVEVFGACPPKPA